MNLKTAVRGRATWVFLFLLISSMPANTQEAWENFLKNSRFEAIAEMLIAGEPKVGEVFCLRQIHKSNLGWELEKSYVTTLQSQYEIFLALKALKPDAIVTECGWKTFSAGKVRQDRKAMEVISKYLPQGWYRDIEHAQDLTEQQKNILYNLGAGMVYLSTCALEGTDVLLEGVEEAKIAEASEAVKSSPEVQEWIKKSARQEGASMLLPAENMPDVLLQWEKIHADTVENFLKGHPGARVVLIFGAAHRFERHFKNLNCRLFQISFRKL